MEYQNIDEATRREACERVKKIAEAIKKIRKKYYLCFNKISDADKQRYDELKVQMQNVASENGLDKLSAELISDIDTQYNENLPNDINENGMPSNNSIEEAYQMYLKAVQLLAEFTVQFKNAVDSKLEKAYMKRAQKIQDYIKKLSEYLKDSYSQTKLNEVRRNVLSEKFNEQAKVYFYKLFEDSYQSANDPLIKSDILGVLNTTQVEKKVQPLGR